MGLGSRLARVWSKQLVQKVWNRKIVRTGKAAGWLGVVYSWYYTLTTQLVDWCWVDNVSMEPTLYHGDIVILRPVGYSWINAVEYKDIKAGDLVIARHPGQPVTRLAKRVLLVGEEGGPVPAGRVWLLGDNTNCNSCDSSSGVGPVPLGLLEGKLVWRVWPLARAGPLH